MASSNDIVNSIKATAQIGSVRWAQARRAAGRDPKGPDSLR